MTLVEDDSRTRMTMLSQYAARDIRDIMIRSGIEGGMQEGMDLLEELAIALT